MIEEAKTSAKTSVKSIKLHGIIHQNTVIFIRTMPWKPNFFHGIRNCVSYASY